jgi:hypothetical protein
VGFVGVDVLTEGECEMSNLVAWIEEMANGAKIEGVVIGEMGWGDYGSDGVPNYEKQPKGKLLSWDEARPLLDYEFHAGFGAPSCNAVCAWTKYRVIGISQYDGSTAPFWMPRNPVDYMPEMQGGG